MVGQVKTKKIVQKTGTYTTSNFSTVLGNYKDGHKKTEEMSVLPLIWQNCLTHWKVFCGQRLWPFIFWLNGLLSPLEITIEEHLPKQRCTIIHSSTITLQLPTKTNELKSMILVISTLFAKMRRNTGVPRLVTHFNIQAKYQCAAAIYMHATCSFQCTTW